MRISYYQDYSGIYFVKLFAGSYSQTIVVGAGYFRKVMRSKGNVVVGCCDVEVEVVKQLGFIVPGIWEKIVV